MILKIQFVPEFRLEDDLKLTLFELLTKDENVKEVELYVEEADIYEK